MSLVRDSEGRVAKQCSDCHGLGIDAGQSWDFSQPCDRCGGEGLVSAFPLVLVDSASPGFVGYHPLLTAEYVYTLYSRAMCFVDGWEACAHRNDRGDTAGYADVRDWLLSFDADELVAQQVALQVTRPPEFFWLKMPVLF